MAVSRVDMGNLGVDSSLQSRWKFASLTVTAAGITLAGGDVGILCTRAATGLWPMPNSSGAWRIGCVEVPVAQITMGTKDSMPLWYRMFGLCPC